MQDLDLSFLVPCFFNCTPSYHLLLSSFSSFLPPSIVLLTFPTTLVQKAFPYKIIAIVLTMMEQMCAILTSFTTIFFITSLYFQGSLCWAFSIAASSSVSTKSSLTSPQHNNHLMISNCKTKSSITTSPLNEQEAKRKLKSKTCVLICPAQFCVPADYIDLVQHVQQISSASGNSKNTSIGCCKVAPLPRTEWIKVAKQIFSKDFFRGTLRARITLDWYFAAMEDALASIYAQEGEATNVCLVGHSIGGWVARAYLGGLSGSCTAVHRLTQERCTSLITLGTPHLSPDSALVDQTRGLLQEIADAETCSPKHLFNRGIQVTCVGSAGVNGTFLTTNLEEIIAAASYLTLMGSMTKQSCGDGIVPFDLAFMEEPARRVAIAQSSNGRPVRHAGFFPTPWNLWDGYSESIRLPEDYKWYGSKDVIDQWAPFIY